MMATLTEWFTWSISTWNGLPLALQAFIISVVFVSAIVGTIKRAFFMSYPKAKRKAWIWRTALTTGILCGILGYKLSDNLIPVWYWVFISGVSGSFAMKAHWFSTNVMWPYIKNKFRPGSDKHD